MTLSAFQADFRIREVTLQRLADHVEARNVVRGALFWDGKQGSIAGCMIESNNAAQWELQLGLPRWFAYLIDTATNPLKIQRAHEETRKLLGSILLGMDISALGYSTITALLDDITANETPEATLSQAMAKVRALHQCRTEGNEVEKAEWKSIRQMALATCDALPSLPENIRSASLTLRRQHAIGSVIEAAGWDPLHSPTATAEVLRHWLLLQALNINHDFGWIPADDKKVEVLLSEMYERYIAPNPQEKRDVFQLLAEYYPAEEARLNAYNRYHTQHGAECAGRVCTLLQRLLKDMS